MLHSLASSHRLARQRPARAAAGLVLAVALALLGSLVPGSSLAAETAGTDAPAIPVLSWADCGGGFQCATAAVPLDYARPHGRTISIALIKLPASDPAHRIGSLFTNPGGPGGSGVQFIRFASGLFPSEIRARFDLVGFDPRGVAASTPVRCFESVAEQQAFFRNVPPFPVGPREERAFIETFEQFGALCRQRNRDLLPHMSTANADRDMDLLRQAVGDRKLSYLGLSYGTYLGASYVNLFPNRVRAVVLDGAIEPVEWSTGRDEESETLPFSTRLKSDDGAFKTLGQFLDLCAAGGPERCAFAAGSREATHEKFDDLLHGLLEHPIVVPVPGGTITVTYAVTVNLVLGALYRPAGWPQLAQILQFLAQQSASAGPALLALRQALAAPPPPYDNSAEAATAVFCADSDNPDDPFAWPRAGREADERAPYFGRAWTFVSQACATWGVRDRARYTGPWNRHTSNPVLVVGNRFDPATRYESAVALSRELARGRLLTLDGWGHTSLLAGSACTQQFETSYLLTGALPPAGTVCQPDQVPFAPTTPQQSAAERGPVILTGPAMPGTPGL